MNVKLKDCPCESLEELRTLPESEVTVCGMESWFVQVTFVPALTVSCAGLNAKLLMLTEAVEACGTVAGAETETVGDVVSIGAMLCAGA